MLAGTSDGAYRVTPADGRGDIEYERTLDADRVMRVRRFDALDGAFAATRSGLYRSLDGETWTDLGVPRDAVYSVAASPSGHRLYAGTHPAHVYVASTPDDGDAAGWEWRDLDGFQELPSRDDWHTPRHDDEAHVRALRTHAETPGRVVAGVEAGGVHVSDDDGATWAERTAGVPDDVHHLLVRGPDDWVASTGFGLYRTRDAGRSWTRLDDAADDYRYVREATRHDGTLYAAAATGSSAGWSDGADARLSEVSDGDSLAHVAWPRPDEVVLAWAVVDGDLYAGTNAGSLLRRRDGGWQPVCELPVGGQGVRSLCAGPVPHHDAGNATGVI